MSIFVSVMSGLFSILVLIYWAKNSTIFNSIVFGLIYLSLIVYLVYFIWVNQYISIFSITKIEFPNFYMRLFFILLLLITIVLLILVYFTKFIHSVTKNKEATEGNIGEFGLKGESGNVGICNPECKNNLSYKKILNNVTNSVNKWLEANGKIKYANGQTISNMFIKKKIKQLCESKEFKQMVKKHGITYIDTYVNDKWNKWILTILKYDKGLLFLETDNLTDNDFNSMITDQDKLYSNISNLSDPGTPNRGKESPFDDIKKTDLWYWGENPLLKPKIVNDCDPYKKNESSNKFTPEPILKMKETNSYTDYLWGSKNARQRVFNKGYKYNKCIPYNKCIIEYGCTKWRRTWRRFRGFGRKTCVSKGMGCMGRYIPACNYVPECKRESETQIKQKGDKEITVYRPTNFVDNTENLDFKDYRPLGDVAIKGNFNTHKKNRDEACLPLKSKDDKRCSKFVEKVGDPRDKSILISGDTTPPKSYKQMYSSKRDIRNNAKKVGYSFWRPIPQEGYMCLGDIIDNSYHNQMPSTDLIRCVPKKCVRKVNNHSKLWDSSKSPNDKCTSESPCDCLGENIGNGATSDSDFKREYGEAKLYKSADTYNLFRSKDPRHQDKNGSLYELIPKNDTGNNGEKSCFDIPNIEEVKNNIVDDDVKYNEWIVPEKIDDNKYSIDAIYEK